MEPNYRDGELLLINKPYTWSSFQAVNKLKHALKKHPSLLLDDKFVHLKIGHAGTLDPLATGLLIICTGKKTKDISQFQDLPKEYTGTFLLVQPHLVLIRKKKLILRFLQNILLKI